MKTQPKATDFLVLKKTMLVMWGEREIYIQSFADGFLFLPDGHLNVFAQTGGLSA